MLTLETGWNKSASSAGFSLVELLIIFLIIGLISTIAIISMDLRSFNAAQPEVDIKEYFSNLTKESILMDQTIQVYYLNGTFAHCYQNTSCELGSTLQTKYQPNSEVVKILDSRQENIPLNSMLPFLVFYPNGSSSYAKLIFADDATFEITKF